MIFQGWFSHVTRFLRWTPKNISQNGFIFPKKCLKPQPSQQFTPENRPVGPPKGNEKVVNPCIYPKKKQWKIVKSSRKSSRIFPSNQNGMGWSSLLLYWLTGVYCIDSSNAMAAMVIQSGKKWRKRLFCWESKSLLMAALLISHRKAPLKIIFHFPKAGYISWRVPSNIAGKIIKNASNTGNQIHTSYFLGVSFPLTGHLPEVSNWKSSKIISRRGFWKIPCLGG